MSEKDNLDDLDELRMADESYNVAKRLVKGGVRVVPRPIGDDVPQLPRDVTSLHEETLMELWGRFTSWCDYLSVQAASAEIDRRAAERALDAHTAGLTFGEGAKESVAKAKARAASDPRTVELGETLDEAHAYAKLCRVLVENLERDSQFLSRELTRRVGSGGSNIARANRRM